MTLSKEQLKEEIKKHLFQQLLEQKMLDEGVGEWMRNVRPGAAKTLRKAADIIEPKDDNLESQLSKLANFFDFYSRDKKVQDAIKQTTLGKKLFTTQKVNEAYESQVLQYLKQNKLTVEDIEQFVQEISKFSPEAAAGLNKFGVGSTKQDTQPPPAQTQKKPTPEPVVIGPTTQQVPNLVPDTVVKTKKAQIRILPPVEDNLPADVAQKQAQTQADRLQQLKLKRDTGQLSNKEKDELLGLLGIGTEKQTKKQRKLTKEILIQEIFNTLTGKNK